jgi:uncharacterized protein involved in outer membrane biogenesis
MKFLIRWAIRLFIISIVLVVALVLLKDTLLKALTEYQLRSQTGLDVKIGRFEVGLSSPRLTVENLRLYNSAEFGGSALVDIPELHLECDPSALALGRLHLKLLRLHLSEVNIVESKDGRTNIMVLMERMQEKNGRRSSDTNRVMGVGFQGIDTLNLTVGKVKYSSLRKPSSNMEIDVGLKNEVLMNVKSFQDLSALLLKVMFRKGINIFSRGVAPPVAPFPGLVPSLITNASKASLPAASRHSPLTNTHRRK